MVGVINRFSGFFDVLFSAHRRILQEVQKLEDTRKVDDKRIDNLFRATLDGDEKWFLDLVKKDPSCAMKVIEECDK